MSVVGDQRGDLMNKRRELGPSGDGVTEEVVLRKLENRRRRRRRRILC